jgi:hypothetical protein
MHSNQLLLSLCLTTALPALAGEDKDIAELYQFNCTSCHGAEVYTRADRKVTSLTGLDSQVRRCEQSLNLKWFDEDIANMAGYLNTHYYQFKP